MAETATKTEKKRGVKPPAQANALVPEWIKPEVQKLAQALSEKPAVLYAAAITAFAGMSTEDQFAILGPVKVKHANAVKQKTTAQAAPAA